VFDGIVLLSRLERRGLTAGAKQSFDEEALVRVFAASSEVEALAIQALLEQEGIEAALHNDQIPMYDGIAQAFNPVWGSVLVRESSEGLARDLIDGYLEAIGTKTDDTAEEGGEEAGDE